MATTLERTLSCTSSMSLPVSSPRLSVRRENTPPASSSDQGFVHLHDRIQLLDSRVQDLRSTVLTKDAYVERRNREDEHIRREFEAQRAVLTRIDADVIALRSRIKHMERTRFNSLAHTVHAPITPVPMIDDDGSVRWPEYFPRTVWRFWCLKKRSRVNRLVELAEFYQLEGYQYWSRMHQSETMFSDSDSSDSTDSPSNLTRAEAVTLYPEAAHQALAATLGLVYYKIRKEVGEGAHAHIPRPPKRAQEEVVSVASSRQKPVKVPRRANNVSPTTLHRLITGVGPSLESKSLASEESDKLGWNAHSAPSAASAEDAVSRFRGIVYEEVGALLRALEQGRIRLKPSRSERQNMSPTDTKPRSVVDGPAQDDDNRTVADTVATELLSPLNGVELPLPPADRVRAVSPKAD